jgi:hypothetical protein
MGRIVFTIIPLQSHNALRHWVPVRHLHSHQTVLDYGCVARTRLLFENLQWEGPKREG